MCDKIKYQLVDNIFDECLKFVKDNFKSICPFEITDGYSFQIRMNEFAYSELPEKYKKELESLAIPDAYDDSINPNILERYKKDFFWINCKEYIYNFKIENAMHILVNCTYDEEGVSGYAYEVLLVDKGELTPFILLNIDLDGDEKPKIPDNSEEHHESN